MKRLRWRRWWIVDGDDPHLHAGPYLTQGAALSAAAKMWHHGWWKRHPRRWVAKDGQEDRVRRDTDRSPGALSTAERLALLTAAANVPEGRGFYAPTEPVDEPDRPRRDVSIEEAERMPMTDEELAAIEAIARRQRTHREYNEVILDLVAEVRRLRAHYHERQTQVDWLEAEVLRLRTALQLPSRRLGRPRE